MPYQPKFKMCSDFLDLIGRIADASQQIFFDATGQSHVALTYYEKKKICSDCIPTGLNFKICSDLIPYWKFSKYVVTCSLENLNDLGMRMDMDMDMDIEMDFWYSCKHIVISLYIYIDGYLTCAAFPPRF